ncbi:NADP-dependent oxidoreductase [Burkholderia cenocepacia]
MKVIELQSYGGADALHLAEYSNPTVGPGQVLVRVVATSFNPIDPKRASGALKAIFPLRFPFVPGGDVSGIVEMVGVGATGYAVGDAVYGYTADGGAYAEYIAIDATKIAKKPANLSHMEAASLALVGQTATQAVEAAGVEKGRVVLIQGAGGAVGSIAVQLAHRIGARVIGTASPNDAERLLSYGADQIISRDTPFEDQVAKVDAVIDTVGEEVQARSLKVLKPGGILVALSQPPSQDEAARQGVRAVMLLTETSTANLDTLRERIESGDVIPFLGRSYPLADVPQAWREAADGKTKGRIVFQVIESIR